jgi:subtilisin family serine protease
MSKKTIFLLVVAFLLIWDLLAFASDYGYKEGELLVRFSPKTGNTQTTTAEKNAILDSLGGGEVKHTFKLVPELSVVSLPKGVKVKEVLDNFNKKDGILYAQPNYTLRALSTFPNDPCFSYLWGLHNVGQLYPHEKYYGGGFIRGTPDADIDAPEAWAITRDSNIIVAVIDTGIDYNHPDLAANMWHNPGEIPGNGIDDDNNGYKDDVYGYDFCQWAQYRDSDPMDDVFHGTHVAGIIGAVGNNAQGVTGVCWNVKIMSLKFMQWGYVSGWGWGGYGSTSDAIANNGDSYRF